MHACLFVYTVCVWWYTTHVTRAHAQSPVKDSQNVYVIVKLYTIKRYPHTTWPAAHN